MTIQYDPKYDILNIEFLPDEKIVDSFEIDGVIIDYGKEGKIVSIEVIDASKRTKNDPLDLIDFKVIKEAI